MQGLKPLRTWEQLAEAAHELGEGDFVERLREKGSSLEGAVSELVDRLRGRKQAAQVVETARQVGAVR